MMEEKELRKYDWNNPPSFAIPRSKEVQAVYDKNIKTDLHQQFIQYVKTQVSKFQIVFIRNTYPYNVKPPIKHSCLWYQGVFTPEDVIGYLKSNKIEYITFFENQSEFKSIKSISHYHIFRY